MPTPVTAASLIKRAQNKYAIPASISNGIKSQLQTLCEHNDSEDPAKVPVEWVLPALAAHGVKLTREQLDRVCVRDLGRYSFRLAEAPAPVEP